MKRRVEIVIKGAVQGIGFRPFIYRLAAILNLKGYVSNTSSGVYLEAEGEKEILNEFLSRIKIEKPSYSFIEELSCNFCDTRGYEKFEILNNTFDGEPDTIILPDLALCDNCLKELFDPSDRRYLYPFINCTNCGPRYSIISSIPYDRINTTMKHFEMCDDCRKEYTDPSNRRFHAEPVACHKCGPKIMLWNSEGAEVTNGNEAVQETARYIRQGKIVALKGLGGFHLLADAGSDAAVRQLRQRKHRDEKPFALMFPSIQSVNEFCEVSGEEKRLLLSTEAPIVLLRSKRILSSYIAPGNPYYGAMLPYTPLHHLLMKELNFPVIATSGNISDEPMCIDENEALNKLKGIADFYLVHNRTILRPVDDSIVKVVLGTTVIHRRSRGYAPLPLNNTINDSTTMIAVGAHLKNSISLKKNGYVFVSHQLGDLSTLEARNNFEKTIDDFKELYNTRNEKYAIDFHPAYYSSQYASLKNEHKIVQHHVAHITSCYGENKLSGEVLGIAWDGTGLGFDKSIWGSEFFIYDGRDAEHCAQLFNYSIPGGEAGIKNIINSAAGIIYASFSEEELNSSRTIQKIFPDIVRNILFDAVKKEINCYRTSSMGRLFDAVSFLLGICNKVSYEGQAAMMLEFCAAKDCNTSYVFDAIKKEILLLDWRPMIRELINDIEIGVKKETISAKFHNTLIKMILFAAEYFGKERILLSGGCFQNTYLLEGTIRQLRDNGYSAYWNKQIPANDSGISYGQIVYLMNRSGKMREQIKQKEGEYVSCSTG